MSEKPELEEELIVEVSNEQRQLCDDLFVNNCIEMINRSGNSEVPDLRGMFLGFFGLAMIADQQSTKALVAHMLAGNPIPATLTVHLSVRVNELIVQTRVRSIARKMERRHKNDTGT